VSWCAMVCHGVSWCVMVCHGVPWCAMVCHGVSWCVMVCHGVPWCAMVCHVVCHVVCHGVPWFAGCCVLPVLRVSRVSREGEFFLKLRSILRVGRTEKKLSRLSARSMHFVGKKKRPLVAALRVRRTECPFRREKKQRIASSTRLA
jgi:hypothetical protein